MYAHLENLVMDGFAEKNIRDPTPEESARKGNRVAEYRKSSDKTKTYDDIMEQLVDEALIAGY